MHVWRSFIFVEQLAQEEWMIIPAYQVISDQRANVFNFMLPVWVGESFIVHGKLR